MVVFRRFPFLPFLSLFSKLYLPSSSSFYLFIFASLHPSMDPSVTLSVLLINLLSPTAAIHSSIRKLSHPSICFSVYLNDLNYRSFLRLLVIWFILCLDLILIQYNRYFYPYSYFFVTNLFRGHIQISQRSTMGKLDDTLTLKHTSFYLIDSRRITTGPQISA